MTAVATPHGPLWIWAGCVGNVSAQVVAALIAEQKVLAKCMIWSLALELFQCPEVVRLSTEKVGTSQIGRTVRVVEAAFHLRLGEADARKHVAAVLVPVAVAVTSITPLLFPKLVTIRPPFATSKWSPVVNLLPRVAHVLETFVFLDFISREIFVAVVVGDAGGEDGDVPQPWEVLLLLLL